MHGRDITSEDVGWLWAVESTYRNGACHKIRNAGVTYVVPLHSSIGQNERTGTADFNELSV